VETQNKEKEETYRVKKRTMDLLPDADSNIAKLQVGRTTRTVNSNVIIHFRIQCFP